MPRASAVPDNETSDGIFKWPSDKKLVLYFTNWGVYGRNFQVKDLPIDDLTGINYAFYDLKADINGNFVPISGDPWADYDQRYTTIDKGLEPLDSWNSENSFYGNFGQIKKLKDAGKKFNVGLSIGGWSWSGNFSPSVETPAKRQAFVDEVVKIFKKYPIFNRVDIDWEYISPVGNSYGLPGNKIGPNDAQNYAEFIKLMRNTLGNKYEITMCTTGNPEKMDILPIKAMVQYLDTVNIMTYDQQDGGWGATVSGHNSNLYKTKYTPFSAEESVKKMISLGVPSNKIMIGVAYYSRGYSNTQGIGKPCSGASPDKSWESGIVDYKDLPLPGATEYYDKEAGAAYSYDPVRQILNSYDNIASVQEKSNFVLKNNLKGIIVWEASGDRPVSSGKSLTRAMANILKGVPPRPTPAPDPKPSQPPVVTNPILNPPKTTKEWGVGIKYNIGDQVTYNGSLYVCISPHNSNVTWIPLATSTLWKYLNKVPVPTPTEPNKCPYLNGKIKKVTIVGDIDISNLKFEY